MTRKDLIQTIQEEGGALLERTPLRVIAYFGTARLEAVPVAPAGLWWLGITAPSGSRGEYVREPEEVQATLAVMGLSRTACVEVAA